MTAICVFCASSERIAQQKRKEALDAQEELYDTLYTTEMNLLQAAWEAAPR